MKNTLTALKAALTETESNLYRLGEQRIALKNQITAIEGAISREPPEKQEGGE